MQPSPRLQATFPTNAMVRTNTESEAVEAEQQGGPRPAHALSTKPSDYSGYEVLGVDGTGDDCGPLVKTPFQGKMSAWENLVEAVLKNLYNSIRQQRLPLHGSDESDRPSESQPCSTSLSAMTGGMLRRTNSMLSKAGSESLPVRGRLMESRTGSRWSSKTRSRPRLYTPSLGHSRTSFDDDMSISAISPSGSSMWSKYSLGKTQTSASVTSLSTDFGKGDFQQSIGFANALSQAIIREESVGDCPDDGVRVGPLLEDESLELSGAPWAKEGILKHKHHLEAVDKRAKDRNWVECFAVIEKGWMRLFQFNVNARSLRQRGRNQRQQSGVVGGATGPKTRSLWDDTSSVIPSPALCPHQATPKLDRRFGPSAYLPVPCTSSRLAPLRLSRSLSARQTTGAHGYPRNRSWVPSATSSMAGPTPSLIWRCWATE